MLNGLSIRNKVLFLLLIPMLAFIAFATIDLLDKTRVLSEHKRLAYLMEMSAKMSALVHEQQKERGATGVFMGSQGAKFGKEMVAQRLNTDRARQELEAYIKTFDTAAYGQAFLERLNAATSELKKLETIRKSIDSLSISTADGVGYYTKLNAKFLTLMLSVQDVAKEPLVVVNVSAYVTFLQAKERAGIERAIGASSFATGFTKESLRKFNELITQQAFFLDIFRSYASDAQEKFLDKKLADPVVAEVQRLRNVALEEKAMGAPSPEVEGPYWFETITKKINLLKEVENYLTDDIVHLSKSLVDEARRARLFNFSVIFVTLLVIALAAMTIIRNIVSGIGSLTNTMSVLAQGNLGVQIPGLARQDEVGRMAKAVQVFKDNAAERERLEKEQTREKEKQLDRANKIEALIRSFEDMSGQIVHALTSSATELQATSAQMTELVQKTGEQSRIAASDSQSANANVQAVAAASEELSCAIAEVSRAVHDSAQLSRKCSQDAEQSQEALKTLQSVISDVDQIIQGINDVAEQTNLLALNATIEAARAGEAGKGFAVVASEVKQLANETHKMTENITDKINAVKSSSIRTISAIEAIIVQVRRIDESSSIVASSVEEQASATQEISSNAQSAAQGTLNVTENIGYIQNAASESGSASENVKIAANDLAHQAEMLRKNVDDFLSEVRRA